MKMTKKDLVQLLHQQGDNDTADAAEAGLPEEFDTEDDAAALESVGLDRTTLQGHLAAGAIGGNLAI